MKELEKKMQNESFDVEVQYCDPDDCNYDCMVSENHCNSHISTLMQNQSESLNICEGEQEMKELEKKMQNENFDVEVQYCDPDDCTHDCLIAPDHCNTHITPYW